jgi:hypothetical protein
MADLPGTEVVEAPRGSSVAPIVITIPTAPDNGTGGYVSGYGGETVYLMLASDSVTLALYSWVAIARPDWAGVGYPGPNTPTNIAIGATLCAT